MRAIILLATKDLKLLFRDRMGLFWFFGFPLLTALFFGSMFGSGPRAGGLNIAVIDEDDTVESRDFIAELKKSPSLKVETRSAEDAKNAVRTGELAGYALLPKGFGKRLGFFGGDPARIEIGMDPSRKAEEGFLQGLLMETSFRGMQKSMRDPKLMRAKIKESIDAGLKDSGLDAKQKEMFAGFMGSLEKFLDTLNVDKLIAKNGGGDGAFQPLRIEAKAVVREGARPATSFEITFPQAVFWGLFGLLMSFAIGMVVERRKGTMLRLRLAPVSRAQLLAGKALACVLACLLISALVLGVGRILFGVRLSDPVGLIVVCVATAVCFTGLIMLVSSMGTTEQGVSGMASGVMMPLAMLGGGMIPLLFMPAWMQTASHFSPVKWTILALEGVIWRGFSWGELLLPLTILVCVGVVCFFLGVCLLSRREN